MCDLKNHFCRICGFDLEECHWGSDGQTPSFAFCDCCGVEFGYQDTHLESIREYRKKWIEEGSQWSNHKYQPINWDLNKQLKQISKLYL
jgi:hypothetical protein